MENHHAPIPFIGREQEIALFKECLDTILTRSNPTTQHPKILNFYGEKGVGKTALLLQFEKIAKELDVVVVKISLDKEIVYSSLKQSADVDFIHFFLKKLNERQFIVEQAKPFLLFFEHIRSQIKQQIPIIDEYISDFTDFIPKEKSLLILIDDINLPFIFLISLLELFQDTLKADNPSLAVFMSEENIKEKAQTLDIFELYKKRVEIPLTYSLPLLPLSFEESKKVLNGFIAQFSDKYIQEIYNYTKGYPSKLLFLLDLVRERQIPMEIILKELISNEGKLLANFEELLKEKQLLEKEASSLEHNVVATMTHNLNQKFGSLLLEFNTIKALIDKQKQENVEQKLNSKLDDFYTKLLDATETFRTTYKVLDKQRIDYKPTALLPFFQQEIAPLALHQSYSIEIIAHFDNIIVEIDKNALKDAFQNLIHNAEIHGFSDTTKNKKQQVIFELSVVKEPNESGKESDFARILCKNNGAAFPSGFSFDEYKRLAGRAGKHKGSGIGGYWINKVISLHHGKFRMVKTNKQDEFAVQFEILIPLQQPHTTA